MNEVAATETRIKTAGVLRCCLATVATEYVDSGKPVGEGDESRCDHCGERFRLVDKTWVPLWQLEGSGVSLKANGPGAL